MLFIIFLFKQKTAYEMRISDWSSDVCSSDLADPRFGKAMAKALSASTKTRFESAIDKFEGLASQDDAVDLSGQLNALAVALMKKIGRASCRERVCQYV